MSKSKYDKLFEKIITSDEMANELGTDAKRYKTVDEGRKAFSNIKIRAIAEMINEIGHKLDLKKSNARVLSEDVNLDPSEFQAIYRKIVSLLTK